MPSWSLRFTDPGGVHGAVSLALLADHAEYRAVVVLGDGPGDGAVVVVVRDDDVPLPRGAALEVRTDGLWAELVCEVTGVHWSLGLEAFGLRFDDLTDARDAEVGDRVPVGLDLEWDEGVVVGEVLVGARRIAVDGRGTFTEARDAPTWDAWFDQLTQPGAQWVPGAGTTPPTR